MAVSITIPADYGYVLLQAVVMSIFCHLLGFMMGGGGRRNTFDKEYMEKYFLEDHQKAFGKGSVPDKQGYPDPGDGRYGKKLVYRKWYEFATRQRIHGNFNE